MKGDENIPIEDIPKHKDLIYDVGMHKGEDTDFYLRKGFRVIAFEADPDLAQSCRARFASAIQSGRLMIVEGAIMDSKTAAEKKTIQFFKNNKNSVWGTVSANWAERNEKLGCSSNTIEINTVDFTAALRKYGIPHYLKIDIEGSDMICVAALKQFRERPDYVSIESEVTNLDGIREEIAAFVDLGYNSFQAIEQSAIPNQIPPNPSREGQYIAERFEEGCSGLFGSELNGEWQSEGSILSRYRKICTILQIMGVLRKWKFRGANRLRVTTGKLLERLTNEPPYGWYDTHARHSSVSSKVFAPLI